METQAHIQMAHGEIPEERTKVEEMQEEQFLKDLYLFMKKRDAPIERIPHLGFKQVDLFVMYKTVQDLGGYHTVTAQQLWKQVYNILGGNPRSTSAATCTRRHYEKLLLPYECHVKGVLLNTLPQLQPKAFIYPGYSQQEDDGQKPAKRQLLSLQNPHNIHSDPHGNVFPLLLHRPPFYRQSHEIHRPFVPISSSAVTSHNSPAPQPRFVFHPSHPNPIARMKEPLEHLRFLSEQYKTSSGLLEPLNLSIKASSQEINSKPTSSFSPPVASKNPKFLNKPSPLYTPLHPRVVRNEACETQRADLGVKPCPVEDTEGYVIELDPKTPPSSPVYDSAPTPRTDTSEMETKPSSSNTDFTIRPTEGGPEAQTHNLSPMLPSPPRENGSKMEIEIPLSVFHNWLQLYGPPGLMHGAKQPHPPFQEEHVHCSNPDLVPADLASHMNVQHHAVEDLRLRPKDVPSSTLNIQTIGNHHGTSKRHYAWRRPSPLGGNLKSAAGQDVYLLDQQDVNKPYGSKAQNHWNAYDKESQAPRGPVNTDCSPLTALQDLTVSKTYNEVTNQGGKEKSAPAVPTENSSSLLHFTTEELMKLKKFVSSSS